MIRWRFITSPAGAGESRPCRTFRSRPVWELLDIGLVAATAGLRQLPEQKTRRFAPLLGKGLRWAHRQESLAHMKCVLGHEDWSEAQWDQLWNAHTRHLGQTILEVLAWQRLPVDQVLARVSVRGDEHLRQVLRAGRGAMVLTNHLGNFVSLAPGFCQLGLEGCSLGNEMPTRRLERMLRDLLRRFGIDRQLLEHGVLTAIAQTFRRGAIVATAVDYFVPGKRDVWLPFGCAETNVGIGPALLALRHRVPAVCVTSARLDAAHHEVTIHPPLHPAESGDAQADARQLTAQALEIVAAGIRQRPEQWWQWDFAPVRTPRT